MSKHHPLQERLAVYDALLVAIGLSVVDQASAHAARFFLDDTAYEAEWLRRTAFIDGSHALLARSMLRERGTDAEMSHEELFHSVRGALYEFADKRTPIPRSLREATRTNIRFYGLVARWQQNVLDGLSGARAGPARNSA